MSLEWSPSPAAPLCIGALALEYACWGPPPARAPTLVLLHEGLGSVGLWKDFPARLAQATGMGVFAYSRAGYGRSDPITLPRPLDFQTREATEVLGPVLNAAGIGQAILLGHSDGATIAAIHAGSVSDQRIRGLILIAPHFFTEPEGLAAIHAAGKAYESGTLKAKLARHHNDVEGAFRGWHGVWTDPEFESWDVADVIDHWRIPCLAIQGTADPYGTLAQIAEIEGRIYAPFESLILADCGHAPHQEHTKETLTAITAFCGRLDRLERVEVALA